MDIRPGSRSTKVAAIVPCFNDAPRIRGVLQVLQEVSLLDTIVVVDDESSDGTLREVVGVLDSQEAYRKKNPARKVPDIRLLMRAYHLGKCAAVMYGAIKASGLDPALEYILLVDPRLQDVQAPEVELAVMVMLANPTIDMLILRRGKKSYFPSLLGGDLLASGERILRMSDLIMVFEKEPVVNFQFEIALNQYMLENGKKIHWLPFGDSPAIASAKIGLWNGVVREIRVISDLYNSLGLRRSWRQMTTLRQIQRAPAIES